MQLSKRNAESIEQLVLYRRLDFAPAADLEGFFSGLKSTKAGGLMSISFHSLHAIPAHRLYDFFALQTTMTGVDLEFGIM